MKKDLCSKILMITKKVPILLHETKNKSEIIWKFARLFVSLLRERRNQVEPRCVERWHLRDDEQFDLAAWFPSLKYRAVNLSDVKWLNRRISFLVDVTQNGCYFGLYRFF
jgi:hypothetical protein